VNRLLSNPLPAYADAVFLPLAKRGRPLKNHEIDPVIIQQGANDYILATLSLTLFWAGKLPPTNCLKLIGGLVA
jgi:hypothetical protein